eukprot:621978-Pyramimonas_sp.AAC.1
MATQSLLKASNYKTTQFFRARLSRAHPGGPVRISAPKNLMGAVAARASTSTRTHVKDPRVNNY